jgi:hypothetical protein
MMPSTNPTSVNTTTTRIESEGDQKIDAETNVVRTVCDYLRSQDYKDWWNQQGIPDVFSTPEYLLNAYHLAAESDYTPISFTRALDELDKVITDVEEGTEGGVTRVEGKKVERFRRRIGAWVDTLRPPRTFARAVEAPGSTIKRRRTELAGLESVGQ